LSIQTILQTSTTPSTYVGELVRVGRDQFAEVGGNGVAVLWEKTKARDSGCEAREGRNDGELHCACLESVTSDSVEVVEPMQELRKTNNAGLMARKELIPVPLSLWY
jgi:hypothetical protein